MIVDCWVGLLTSISKADPRRQQDWILRCLQGRRPHAFAACGEATLCSPPALEIRNRNPTPHRLTPYCGVAGFFGASSSSAFRDADPGTWVRAIGSDFYRNHAGANIDFAGATTACKCSFRLRPAQLNITKTK
jgi:hypothetical protein